MPAVGETSEAEKTKAAKVTKTSTTTQPAKPDSGGDIEHLYMLYDRLNSAEDKVTVRITTNKILKYKTKKVMHEHLF